MTSTSSVALQIKLLGMSTVAFAMRSMTPSSRWGCGSSSPRQAFHLVESSRKPHAGVPRQGFRQQQPMPGLPYHCTTLTSLVRPTSDHTPILATLSTTIPHPNLFRFENARLRNQSFLPAVFPAWHDAAPHADATGFLAGCLKSTRAAAKVWARRNRAPPAIIPDCKFLILLLDSFEETRSLSSAELQLRVLAHERLSLAIRERVAY